MHYLHEADIDFTNKTVIELGCGAGLPGIFALKHGAAKVILQDYVSCWFCVQGGGGRYSDVCITCTELILSLLTKWLLS